MPAHDTFDVDISLAKGIMFTKIVLANGQWRSGMIIVGWLASQKGPVQSVVNNF